MSRFIASLQGPATRTVPLGPCECPGTPHPDGDTAEVYEVLGWDDLYDVGVAAQTSAGAAMRLLVTRAVQSWTLLDGLNGNAISVPIVEATVRLLDSATVNALAEAANAAYEKANAPLPNGSGEGSPRLQPELDTSTPTTPPAAKPTS